MNTTSAGGLSKTRLRRMHDVMTGHVDDGSMPGLVSLVSRRGEVFVDTIGKMALDGAPMARHHLPYHLDDQADHRRRSRHRQVLKPAGV